MSRYALGAIVTNAREILERSAADPGIEMPVDSKGFTIAEWFEHGIVGWDPGLDTYFVQFPDGSDELFWWIGGYPGEIKDFEELRSLLHRMFSLSPGSLKIQEIPRI